MRISSFASINIILGYRPLYVLGRYIWYVMVRVQNIYVKFTSDVKVKNVKVYIPKNWFPICINYVPNILLQFTKEEKKVGYVMLDVSLMELIDTFSKYT